MPELFFNGNDRPQRRRDLKRERERDGSIFEILNRDCKSAMFSFLSASPFPVSDPFLK